MQQITRRDYITGTLTAVAGAMLPASPALAAAAGEQPSTPPQAQPAPAAAKQAQTPAAAAPGTVTFNTVITKLKNKQQVFCSNIEQPDLEAAKKACEGVDYVWIEMQHSTLTWRESQQIIEVVAKAGCIPFVRVPSANVSDIQKAVDSGALGIIIPMVESIEEARNGVTFAKYPVSNRESPNTKPWGLRSNGYGQAPTLWGKDYETNANNNIFIMIQIESPVGTGLIDRILDEVEGIDAVMVASNDFGRFGGDRDGSPTYNAREEIVRKSVLAHGKILAGPSSWANRPGYMLLQGRKGATTTGYAPR
jgi:2-keto-3-deoxy-L-rhamnonate aldolase RhmA